MPHHGGVSRLTLLATSDVHGSVLPLRYADNAESNTGLAKLSPVVRRIRDERGHVLLVDNGDLLQGTPFAYYHARVDTESVHPLIEVLNRMKYDAFVPGNHEFNFGLPLLDRARNESAFPWLSANILREEDGRPYFGQPYVIKTTSDGVRVAILGLTTSYVPRWEQAEHVKGLRFRSAVETAREWVPFLRERERADVIVVSYHGGFECDPETGEPTEEPTGENEGYRLAAEVDGMDVLITGHQHRLLEVRIGGTCAVQPGSQGEAVAEVTLDLVRERGRWRVADAGTRLHASETEEADPEIVRLVSPYEEKVQKWLDRPVCKVIGDMRIHDPVDARLEEHPLVEWINRVQMEASGAEISCTALLDNRAPGFGPEASVRDVFANYPFSNTLRVLRLTGADIKEALEASARYFAPGEGESVTVSPEFLHPKPQHYNYDMWEGIEYEIRVSRPVGERVTRLTRNGRPLDPNGDYEVVMNHYRASGSGHFRMVEGKPVVREIPVEVTDLLIAHMMREKVIRAEVNRNWRVVY